MFRNAGATNGRPDKLRANKDDGRRSPGTRHFSLCVGIASLQNRPEQSREQMTARQQSCNERVTEEPVPRRLFWRSLSSASPQTSPLGHLSTTVPRLWLPSGCGR